MESLVEARLAGKDKAVLDFFRDKAVMLVLYDYYYAAEETGYRFNERMFLSRIDQWIECLKRGDDLKSSGVDIARETTAFCKIFNQQVHASRPVAEVQAFQKLGDIFDKIMSLESVLKDLSAHTPKQSTLPRELTARIPRTPADQIVGRQSELEDLHNHLFDRKQVLVINGMGGVGKTTLAQAYISQYGDEYRHLAWINQTTGDFILDTVNTEGLLSTLGISSTGKDTRALVLEILAALKGIRESPCLLVIDNAQDVLHEWSDYLPAPPNWQILVTSRHKIERFYLKELGFLSEQAAVDLFYHHYRHNEIDRQEVKELVKAVDYHTLTIEILSKIAQSRRMPATKLMQAIDKDLQAGVYILHKQDKIERVTSYLCSIFKTSGLSKEEIGVLKQFACLPSEYHTYRELKEFINPGGEEQEEAFSGILEQVCASGWLLYSEQAASYKMHRILCEVIKKQHPIALEEIASLLENITEKLSIDQTKDNPVHKFPWIPYGKAILGIFPDTEDKAIANLQNNLATVLKDLGDYEGAKELLEKALASDEKNFGSGHPTTAVRYSNLALVLKALGDYKEALKLSEKAVDIFKKCLPQGHPYIKITTENYQAIKKKKSRGK